MVVFAWMLVVVALYLPLDFMYRVIRFYYGGKRGWR